MTPAQKGNKQDYDRVLSQDFEPFWTHILKLGQERFRVTSHSVAFASGSRRDSSFHGRFDALAFQTWAGITELEYNAVLRAIREGNTIAFGICDRVLTSTGYPEYVERLPLYDRRGKKKT